LGKISLTKQAKITAKLLTAQDLRNDLDIIGALRLSANTPYCLDIIGALRLSANTPYRRDRLKIVTLKL